MTSPAWRRRGAYLQVAMGITSAAEKGQLLRMAKRTNGFLTILLARPPAGLQAVVAQGERPFGVRATGHIMKMIIAISKPTLAAPEGT